MRFLFVHQNFPGQFLHVIKHLQAQGHEVVFIAQPNENRIVGVRCAYYERPADPPEGIGTGVRDMELGMRRGEQVARVARNLRGLGFTPDIIIGHHGWGELLNLRDVFPSTPILGYFEFFYQENGQDVNFDPEFPIDESHYPRIRSMNMINLLALSLEQYGQTPTRWQLTRYPLWAQQQIKVLPEGADLDLCRPNPDARRQVFAMGDFKVGPKDKLVTFVARNLEPYRGFHTMMRALPDLLRGRKDVKVIMVGGDDVSYGARLAGSTWRQHMQRELAGKYDASRVLWPGQVPYPVYLSLLQRSDAHVYLTYPFVLSWSLREAMATGCAIIGADVEPVAELITDGRTGLLTSCLDARALAAKILGLLEDPALSASLRSNARRYAEKHLDMRLHLAAFDARIHEITGLNPAAPVVLRPRAAKKVTPPPPAAPPARRRAKTA